MTESFEYETADVSTADRVDLAASVATGLDEAGEPQLGQVLADRRSPHVGGGRQGADIHRTVRKHPQQPKTRRIGQQREPGGGAPQLGLTRYLGQVGQLRLRIRMTHTPMMTPLTSAWLRKRRYSPCVSSSVPVLLVAAGGVGLAHSVLPDHWVPLAVLARARRDPLRRVARLSLLAGIAHVAVSLVLGAIVIAVGLSVRSAIESRTDLVVGAVLILTGVGFLLAEATGHTHAAQHRNEEHDGHPHDPTEDDHHRRAPRGVMGLLVPFGAAASPDLTILPVFLAAAALGPAAAIGSLLVFTLITITTFVTLTTLAAAGGHQLRAPWIDRYANTITALVLILIGVLIATHMV